MILVLAASLVSSTLIGYLLARVFLPVFKPVWADFTLKICMGAGVGVGITSCAYFVARLLMGPATIWSVLTELLLLGGAGVAFWFARDTLVFDPAHPKPRGLLWLLLVACIGSLAIAVPLVADGFTSNPYGAWDAWSPDTRRCAGG